MTEDDARVEQIVQQLLENRLTRGERIQLLRELVRAESDATDELMEAALSRLMERLDDE
jgi:hypothetical protein